MYFTPPKPGESSAPIRPSTQRQEARDEPVQVAVQDGLRVAVRHLGAVVLNQLRAMHGTPNDFAPNASAFRTTPSARPPSVRT